MKNKILLTGLLILLASCTSIHKQEKEQIKRKNQVLEEQKIEYQQLKLENEKLKLELLEIKKQLEEFDNKKFENSLKNN